MPIRSQIDTSMYNRSGGREASIGDVLGIVNAIRGAAQSSRDREKLQKEEDDLKFVNSTIGKYMQGYAGNDPNDLYQRRQGAYNEILTQRPELQSYIGKSQDADMKGQFEADKNALGLQNDQVTLDNNRQVLKGNQMKNLDDETQWKMKRAIEAKDSLSKVSDQFGYKKVLEDYSDVLSGLTPYYQDYATATDPATAFWRGEAGQVKQKRLIKEEREIEDRDLLVRKGEADIGNIDADTRYKKSQAFKNYNNAKKEKENNKRQDMFLSKIDATLRNDTFVKNYTDQLGYAGNTVSLLMSDNPVANQAAKTQLARLSGEVGVLTDADVSRFGGSKAVMSRAKQAAQEALSGKLTPENRSFLLAVAQRFEENARFKLDERLTNLAQGQSTAFGIPYENVMPLVQSYGSGRIADIGAGGDKTQSSAVNDLDLIRQRRAMKNGR